jgi:RNA polymerase sigma factor (sigma-70 family)
MTGKESPIIVRTVLENILKVAIETSKVSLTDINAVLPSDFPIADLDYIFESLWDNRITVTDDLNDSQNIEPFLRRGELSRPAESSREMEDAKAVLLVNPVRSYLYQLSSLEQLSAEQEELLTGKLAQVVSNSLNDSESGINDIERLALDRLITGHLGLVVKVARRYERSGVPLIELILAGNEGLVEAALHFDASKGVRFSSSARWWIGHHLSKCIAENWRASRIPRPVAVNLRRIARIVARYRSKRGVDPTPQFLARALAVPLDEIFFLKGLFESPLSLYGPASAESSDVSLVDTIADSEATSAFFHVEEVCKREIVFELLGNLDPLSRRILSLRFGLLDGVTKSVSDVANLLVIPEDQVRFIEEQSLDKLRNAKFLS